MQKQKSLLQEKNKEAEEKEEHLFVILPFPSYSHHKASSSAWLRKDKRSAGIQVRWLLLLLLIGGHSNFLSPCSWTQVRKHFDYPLPCAKWSNPGGQKMIAYQKMDHTDFSVLYLAVHFRKFFINIKFLFHVWCISPNSIGSRSRFLWKKFSFTCRYHYRELQIKELRCAVRLS